MVQVLVVDDQEDKRTALSSALALRGFEVEGVGSAEASDRVRDSQPPIAIVDLMLHGTTGFELARRLREDAPSTRVILTCEYHFSQTQLEKANCGAIAFVPRPFAVEELSEFLRTKL